MTDKSENHLWHIKETLESIKSDMENDATHILGSQSNVKLISTQLTDQQGILNNICMAALRGDFLLRWTVVAIAVVLVVHVVHHW